MTATFYVGDAVQVMNRLPEKSVDLVLTSPPFLALRSYLPSDHPDKALEGGSQATPGEFIDWLLDVVDACDRVLAPHGSLCVELGDTYAGSGGSGGDYDPGGWREGQAAFEGSGKRIIDAKYERVIYGDHPAGIPNLHGKKQGGGTGWPLAKSLSLIPESFRWAMVYGHNPFTGRQTAPWRLRNVIRWVRPNPPVGALGDKFRPATSELMVFCKSAKRYFDLDAVRDASEDVKVTSRDGHPKQEAMKAEGVVTHGVSIGLVGRTYNKDGGAPPLDWWNIPPGGYVTLPERVNPGEYVDGTLYIASEGCPLHEGRLDPAATALHDEQLDTPSSHSSDTDARPVSMRRVGSAPTDQPAAPTLWDGSSDSPPLESPPAATRRSKASNRTAPAPATKTPDTASDRTPDRIDDTSGERLSDGPRLDSSENRTSEPAYQVDPALESYARTGHKSPELEACTCSFYVGNDDSTSHYAVKPRKPRSGMGKLDSRDLERAKVGLSSGKPGRDNNPIGAPPLDWWEIPPGGYQGSHYAVFPPELCVKPIKAMCPEKVCRVCGEPSRRIVGDAGYVNARSLTEVSKSAWHEGGERLTQGAIGRDSGSLRVAPTLGFSDCGHDDWRPGVVLDPFVGSGTTLMVATGHGRDAIGIDLDSRNFDLALDRVGPFILERAL